MSLEVLKELVSWTVIAKLLLHFTVGTFYVSRNYDVILVKQERHGWRGNVLSVNVATLQYKCWR
jgi:hypothetical protein